MAQATRQAAAYETQTENGWAVGFLLFASIIMVIVGLFHFFAGLAAVIEDEFLVIEGDYAYEVDVTLWGFAHIILGLLVAAAGALLIAGKTWALIVALVLTCISMVGSFLSIPNNAAWSLMIIGLDVGIIWAITTQLRLEPEAR
jgi:hypothetical protein